MKTPLPALALALVLALSALPAAAAGDGGDYCNITDGDTVGVMGEELVGEWSVTHHAGFVRMQGMTLAYPPVPPEPMTIYSMDGHLYALDTETMNDIELLNVEEGAWRFGNDEANTAEVDPVLTDEDIELLADCGIADLPRLIGYSSHVIQGSGSMDMTLRLIMVGEGAMFGILDVTGVAEGYPFMSRRSLAMTR